MKRILITGGAGGVGAVVARRLAEAGHTVRVFDLPTEINQKVFHAGEANIELFWGDITKREDVKMAMAGVDEVIHLAALIVPATEKNPDLAHRVNVEGTRLIAEEAKAESERTSKSIPFRFSSSVTVYGNTSQEKPPIPVDHPLRPTDNYTGTKVKAEEIVRNSGLPWTIYRFAAAAYLQMRKGDFKLMRMIPADNRIEFLHIRDIADAFLHSIDNHETTGKIFVLAGGPGCQMLYREQVGRTFAMMGFPEPNWKTFSKTPFNLDWYDTTESQRVLKFQSRTLDDYLVDFRKSLGWKFFLIRFVAAPLLRLLRIHL